MAKKKRGRRRTSASEKIRQALTENPDASPKEIADRLSTPRKKIRPTTVSQVKYQMKQGGVGNGRRKKKGRRKAAAAGANLTAQQRKMLDDMREAKQLAQRLGGVDKARQLLDMVAELR